MKTKSMATLFAILAAVLYAINVPLLKILLNHVEPTMMASFLYLGAGLGLFLYGLIENKLGRNERKTSAYYSIAPFLGVAFSMWLLNERPGVQFYVALIIMLISTWFMVKDTIELQHTHEHEHTHVHEHSHGDIVHTHEHTHVHTHIHTHTGDSESHSHEHEKSEHKHVHVV